MTVILPKVRQIIILVERLLKVIAKDKNLIYIEASQAEESKRPPL